MKLRHILTVVAVFAVALVGGGAFNQGAVAQNDQQNDVQNSEQSSNDVNTEYEYVAQTGDSYSLIARKAVQTFGINNEINLSQAQIIFAETNLTVSAGSPFLDVGQIVKVSENDVNEWVEKAQNLSSDEEAAWSVYVGSVDFDTSSVGE